MRQRLGEMKTDTIKVKKPANVREMRAREREQFANRLFSHSSEY